MTPSARATLIDSSPAGLPELRQRALDGDRQAAQLLIRQGVALIPELLDSLLRPSSEMPPLRRRRLVMLIGRLAAHWPEQLLDSLSHTSWQKAPAAVMAELLESLKAITGMHQERVIDMALEILSEPERFDEDSRLVATGLLVNLPRPRSAEILWWALLNDPAAAIKQAILDGMEKRPLLRAPEAIQALVQLHLDPYLAEYHPHLMAQVEHLLHRLRSELVLSGVLQSQNSEMLL